MRCNVSRKKNWIKANKEDWRAKKILHKTPGGKLTQVKISSLPADEQQKYNPNRFRSSGSDTEMTPDDYMDAVELMNYYDKQGMILDVYIQVSNIDELDTIDKGEHVLATSDINKVHTYFDDNKPIVKLMNVPIVAFKEILQDGYDEYSVEEFEDYNYFEFEDISTMEPQDRYDLVKFSDMQVFKIDFAEYQDDIDIIVDDDEDSEELKTESFLSYYFC